jgi:hypothetical protein
MKIRGGDSAYIEHTLSENKTEAPDAWPNLWTKSNEKYRKEHKPSVCPKNLRLGWLFKKQDQNLTACSLLFVFPIWNFCTLCYSPFNCDKYGIPHTSVHTVNRSGNFFSVSIIAEFRTPEKYSLYRSNHWWTMTVLSATKEWESGGQAESLEWYIEGYAFSRSYDLAPRSPPPPQWALHSTGDTQEDYKLLLKGEGRGWARSRIIQNGRKPGPL